MTTSPPVLYSLLEEYPGLAYRCLNDAGWSMQYASPGAYGLTGFRAEAFLGPDGIAYADLVHPSDRERIQGEITEALEAGVGFVLTYRIVTAKGVVKFVHEHGNAIRDADGCILALHGFIMDVTGVREIQQTLDEVTERFKWIAQATNDNIWDWDLRTDQLWHGINFRNIFALPSDETRTEIECWSDLIHPDDRQWVLAGIHEAIDGETRDWSAEYRLQRKDGSFADVLDRAFIIRDPVGHAIRMVGGVSDLTERKQSKLNLERLSRALGLLKRCNERLIRAADEQTLLADICQVIVDIGNYQGASVNFAGDGVLDLSNPVRVALRDESPVIVSDIAGDSRIHSRDSLLGSGYRSGIWLPLAHDRQTLGVLAVFCNTLGPFDIEEVQLLQALADSVAFGLVNIRSREQRRRIETAAVKIAAGVSATTGDAFFGELTRNMALAVGADGAFVARFVDEALDTVRTVSAIVDGEVVPNFEYQIAGSPCVRLMMSPGCVVLNDVAACFPSSGAAKMQMHGYAGCRLDSAAGRPLGLLFVLFRRPITHADFATQAVQIFAARAAAELERQFADARIIEQASLLDKAKDAIVVHDASNRITFWNKGAERLFGLTADAVLGTQVHHVVYNDALRFKAMSAALSARQEWQGEITLTRADAGALTLEVNATLTLDGAGQPASVLSIITDITRRKAAEQEAAALAFHDRLTGLPNRHFLEKQLHRVLDARTATGEGALLWIDLDRLKSLNDTRGHAVGDLLLQQTGQRIKAAVGGTGVAARFGGDEFVVMVTDLSEGPDTAVAVAMTLLQRLNEPYHLEGEAHTGSASIGLTYFRCGRDTAADILKRADIAMYEAKAAGRNTLRLFDEEMQKSVDVRAVLEIDLRQALQDNALSLAYQPQITENGHVKGVEVLLRWNHPTRGAIPPAQFIPVAENSGLILACGEWVLEQACRQLRCWKDTVLTQGLSIAVNVSAQQIRHPGFVMQVLDVLRRTGADPTKLKLELTESTLVTDTDATIATMKALKASGISFSLDDFGTGFSSLSYLKRLPLDQLKIDRSFVLDIVSDANAAVITRSVIALGQSLGLEVIAEGVETECQRRFLAQHGCRIYQGYLFSRPLSIDGLNNYLLEKSNDV